MQDIERPFQFLLVVGIAIVLIALAVPAVQSPRTTGSKSEFGTRKNTLKQVGLMLYNYHEVHHSLPNLWTDRAHELQASTWRRNLVLWNETHHDSALKKLDPQLLDYKYHDYLFDYNLTPEKETTVVAVIESRTGTWNEKWKIDGQSVRCVSLPYETLAVDRQRGWVTVEQVAEYYRTTGENKLKPQMFAMIADGAVRDITQLPE